MSRIRTSRPVHRIVTVLLALAAAALATGWRATRTRAV